MKKLAMTQEKTASLMMLVMFLMIVFIGACATTPATRAVWSKPNATQQDFAKDMDDCMKKAQATGSASTNVDLYNRCMETQGWTLKEVKSVSESSGITESYTFADGTRYEGTMANGKPHGRGTYNWTNGNKYEGDWFEGKMSGKGKYTCKNGREFTGNFENNKPVALRSTAAVIFIMFRMAVRKSSQDMARIPMPTAINMRGRLLTANCTARARLPLRAATNMKAIL